MTRTDNNRKVKAIWKARNDEKGKSRRPTRTCNSEIGKLLKQRVKNWREKWNYVLVQDRKEWRNFYLRAWTP
jgi:hypothetical protein